MSLAHVREVLAARKVDYNTIGRHSALEDLTPAAFAKFSDPGMQRDETLRYIEVSAPRPVAPPSDRAQTKPRLFPSAAETSSSADQNDTPFETKCEQSRY
jgi:putative transposase